MIILVRHGQTIWNVDKRKQGRKNSPLTVKGLEQAQKIGSFLSSYTQIRNKIEIISSPLPRAWQTASIIYQNIIKIRDNLKLNICLVDELMEHSFGDWEGLTEVEIEKLYPGELNKRKNNLWEYRINNGESFKDLYERTSIFYNNLNKDKDYILVTHEMVSKSLRGMLLNLNNNNILALNHPHDIFYTITNEKVESHKII